jgi:hypothetical protein
MICTAPDCTTCWHDWPKPSGDLVKAEGQHRSADLAPRRSVLGVSLAARPRSGHSCGWRPDPAVDGAGPRTGLGAPPQFLCEQPTR